MKRIMSWFASKISWPGDSAAVEQPGNLASRMDDVTPNDNYEIETSYSEEGTVVSEERAKNVLMPDIYADGQIAFEPHPEIHDQPSQHADETAGFNPYDTAVLDKKP